MKKVLIVLLVLFLATPVFAGNEMYVKGNIGLFIPGDFDIKLQNIKIGEAPAESGVGFSGAFGQSLANGVDLEAEFGYRTADFEDSEIDVDVKTLMVNAIYNFNKGATFSPYVGGGLGIGWISIEDYSGSAFAYQFLTGLEIDFTNNVSGLIGYRYVGTGEATDEIEGWEASTDLDSHNLEVGLKYSF